MRNLSIISIFIIIITLFSCEKEVNINMSSSTGKVVVQGGIENGLPPYVLLSSTISFFAKVDLSTLEKSFIHGAVITVSDGNRTVTLKEYSFDTGTIAKFYIYSIDTPFNPLTAMLGETGKFYTLSITCNGQTYTSVTKVPS